MNPETLERLMIDRAVGGLPPDAEELLDAWLAEEPAAQRDASEIEETIGLARMALRDEPRTNVVVLPANRSMCRNRTLALAACFAGGLFLGVVLHREAQVAPSSIVASAPVVEVNRSSAASSSVWSMARLRGGSAPEKRNVVWISPVRKPKIL